MVATVATAHDFEVDGICYAIISSINKTVEVTFWGNSSSSYDEYRGNVVIPKNVTYNNETYNITSIGYDAFNGCTGLTSITIPNSVTSIGDYVFYGCTGLTSITIPNSVTKIGESAFDGCSGLKNAIIGNSVTSIGDWAFSECYEFTNITSLIPADKLFSVRSRVFSSVDKINCTLYVPYGAKETYAATDGWKDFENIMELEEANGIEKFVTDNVAPVAVYDLNGRVVDNPSKGIYIINGKKVYIK